jgi:hypothetical protein
MKRDGDRASGLLPLPPFPIQRPHGDERCDGRHQEQPGQQRPLDRPLQQASDVVEHVSREGEGEAIEIRRPCRAASMAITATAASRMIETISIFSSRNLPRSRQVRRPRTSATAARHPTKQPALSEAASPSHRFTAQRLARMSAATCGIARQETDPGCRSAHPGYACSF